MNKQELERWLAEHNYPAFIIDTNDVVRPGYEAKGATGYRKPRKHRHSAIRGVSSKASVYRA